MLGCARQNPLLCATWQPGWLLVVLLGCAVGQVCGQAAFTEDEPAVFVPIKPPTRKELDRRDSLKQSRVPLDKVAEELRGRIEPKG